MATRATPLDQLEQLKRKHASEKHLIDKLKTIRALHMVTYNSTMTVEQMAVEFYYAIGDILEGQKPDDLNLKTIDKDEFMREVADGC
jgi:hypothetical protein